MADIFISYARADRGLAQALAQDLISQGYSVWWDTELVGADDFYEVILDALQRAKAAIVIWSQVTTKSRFVRDEARFAMHLGKLIAVRVPDLDIYNIPFGFQGQQTDDLNDREQIYRAVAKRVRGSGRPRWRDAASDGLQRSVPASDWNRIKTTGNIYDIIAFLESNPPDSERQSALSRLKQLAASANPSRKPTQRPQPRPLGQMIFISYRRSDAAQLAGRIYDRLRVDYQDHDIFFDVDSIPLGVNFEEHIRGAVGQCAVMLAVVNKSWVNPAWVSRRWWFQGRLQAEDYVRTEIEVATEFGVPIIPVLASGAEMPKLSQLPASISDFVRLNAARVRDGRDFHGDMDNVLTLVRAFRDQLSDKKDTVILPN